MKKIYILTLILLAPLSFVNANWYSDGTNNFVEGNNVGSANVTVLCDGDNENDDGTAGEVLGQISPAQLSSNASEAGTVNCESWDGSDPTENIVHSTLLWTNGNVVMDIICNDKGGSGCNMIDIVGWNKVGNVYTRTFTFNESGNISIADSAGNTKLLSYNIGNIDKTGPQGTVSYSGTGWTNADVNVSVTCDDLTGAGCLMGDLSGWSKSGNTYTKTFESNDAGNISLTDAVGNVTDIAYSVANIDKIAPSITDLIGSAINLLGIDIVSKPSENFSFSVNNGSGSPIVSILAYFENYLQDITPLDLESEGLSLSSTDNSLNILGNISETNNGTREYSLLIDEICDEAGNCLEDVILNYNIIEGTYVEEVELLSAYTGELKEGKLAADIKGNFDQLFLQFASGGLDYVIAVPSLIVEDTGSGNIIDIIDNEAISFDGYGNVPESFDGLQSDGADLEFSNKDILLFKGKIDLTNDNDLNLIANNLRNYYNGTVLTLSEEVKGLLSRPNSELIEFIRPRLKQTDIYLEPTKFWMAEDPNCNKQDISIDGQVWAGCNSTLGTSESYTDKKCYDSSGLLITCNDPQLLPGSNENGLIVGGVENIWGGHYTGNNADTACPAGWKVPSTEDIEKFEKNLGCTDYADNGWRCNGLGAKRSKEQLSNLVNAFDLPMSGNISGNTLNIGMNSYLWTSTINGSNPSEKVARQFYINEKHIEKNYKNISNKYSVRCIKE